MQGPAGGGTMLVMKYIIVIVYVLVTCGWGVNRRPGFDCVVTMLCFCVLKANYVCCITCVLCSNFCVFNEHL